MNDIKHQILDEIRSHVDVFKPADSIRYRIRCPICGDSQHDPKDAHCYIKCSNDPNEPLLYICFKCNASGRVNKYFLSRLGIDNDIIAKLDNQRYNKVTSIKTTNVEMMTGTPNLNSPQARYIEQRLGKGFTAEDLDRFKIVWDMGLVAPYASNERIRNSLPSNFDSITFVSDDKSMLLNRTFLNGEDSQWRKIKLFDDGMKSFYTIKSTLNLFTSDPIIINIAEGVFDILSVYKNFNEPNSVFIATLGSNYTSAVDYMIAKGFVGSNITVRVYMDNGIDEKNLKNQLKQYRWLFHDLWIIRNIKSKDIGVPVDQIKLAMNKV